MAGSRTLAAAAQPGKFVLVGTGGYLANLSIFAALLAIGIAYILAAIAAYFCSNSLMYLANRYFTFRLGNRGFWSAYLRYTLVGAVIAGLNAGLLAALVEGAGLDPRLGLAISLLVLTPVAFVVFKRWALRAA